MPPLQLRYSYRMPTLSFLGAAQTVTGSKHLVNTGRSQVLVDAGLFQGHKELRLRNWADLPMPARDLDAIVLTHAHLDHVGYLPRIVSQGFRGRVFCTPGTMDLAKLVLVDSANLQEEDARQANREGYSRHHPALPLYSVADAWRALSQLQPVGYERQVTVAPGVEISFVPMGHLLGSAAVRMQVADGPSMVFGGDLGRFDRPVLKDPHLIAHADVLLVESTYGDRQHEPDDDGARLAGIIAETAARNGRVIVPSFAVGRVEEVLYWIRKLELERRIPVLPVYLDSPMATEALNFYGNRVHELDPEFAENGGRLAGFLTRRFTCVTSTQQSKDLVRSDKPAIVISSSGMATGGRVLHYLRAALPDPKNTILFVGYQAAGTRGRHLVDGVAQVKMHGRLIDVHARIEKIDSMSAHADAGEIMRWLRGFAKPPKRTYLVHGEPPAQRALSSRIQSELGWDVHIPAHGESVQL
jgi:metallo-beta-lactamase family protein